MFIKKISFLLFPFLHCFPAASQQAVSNQGPIVVHAGASMTVRSSFFNTAQGTFQNNGTVYVSSNVTNDQPLMNAGTGTLVFEGNARQTLMGSQPFQAYHLVTNNSNGLLLQNDLSISGVHSFLNGIIASAGADHFLVYEAGASYSGENNTSHVSGWVKKKGTGSFSFPVGNGTLLRKVGITNLSEASVFTAHYFGNTPYRNYLKPPLISVNANEYWEINKLSGGTAQVILNWDQSQVGFPNYATGEITVAQYTGGYWTNTGGVATGSPGTTGTIVSNPLASFGLLVIGSTGTVLPLRFLNLLAYRSGNSTELEWKTAHEEAVEHYEVQRSTVGGFHTIALMKGKGSLQTAAYSYTDRAILSGRVLYRIRAVDFDGAMHLSGIASVDMGTGKTISIINPVGNSIQLITAGLPQTSAQYKILTEEGQMVALGTIQLGGLSLTIPLPKITPGTYLLALQYGKEQYHVKFTKLSR